MTNPVKGAPVTVNVTAHPPGAPQPYSLQWRLGTDPWQNDPIDLPRNSGSHDMTFNLIDNSGKGLRFRAQASDAMWVRTGNVCPTAPGNGNNQMSNGAVSADRMQLTINDDNSGNRRNLKYALRFDPAGNDYDPDIRNGGGSIGGGTSAALTTTLGAVAGVAATFLFTEAVTTTNVLIGAAIGALIGLVAGLIFGSMRNRSLEGAQG